MAWYNEKRDVLCQFQIQIFVYLYDCVASLYKEPSNCVSFITYFCGDLKCLWKSGNTLQTEYKKEPISTFFIIVITISILIFVASMWISHSLPFKCYSKDKLIKVLKVIFNRNGCLYVTFMISQLRIRNGLRCYVFLWLCLCLIKRTVSN